MSLRQVRYVIAIARAGSLSEAARQLHVSQPALTLQLRQLEARLGCALFARHARGVTLTEAGAAYLAEAQPAIAGLDRAEAAVAALRDVLPKAISLGLTPTAGGVLMPALLDPPPPGPALLLREGLTHELLAALHAGDLDAACCYADSPRDATALYREEFILVGPPALVGTGGPLAVAALAGLPLVLGHANHPTRRFVDDAAAAAGITIAPALEAEPAAAKRALLIGRELCAIVPSGLYHADIAAGRLAGRRLAPPMRRTAWLVARPGAPAALTRHLLGCLRPLIAGHVAAGTLGWMAP